MDCPAWARNHAPAPITIRERGAKQCEQKRQTLYRYGPVGRLNCWRPNPYIIRWLERCVRKRKDPESKRQRIWRDESSPHRGGFVHRVRTWRRMTSLPQ
nr:MAG TPA: hypothetical protein [Caudoviricetes sp.]